MPLREWPAIAADLSAVQKLREAREAREAIDYPTVCALAPTLLLELHAEYVRQPDRRRDALTGLIRCYYVPTETAERLAVRGLPIMMVKAAQACPEELESPVWLGFSVWLRGSISGSVSRPSSTNAPSRPQTASHPR